MKLKQERFYLKHRDNAKELAIARRNALDAELIENFNYSELHGKDRDATTNK